MPQEAIIKKKRPLPLIWILPLIALIAACWMIYKAELNKGPLVSIQFDNAEGLHVQKTKVKCKSVDIGIVETIELNDDFTKAIVGVRIKKGFETLLTEDSRMWVEKPRIGNRGISGMGTILSGAFIEFEPGTAKTLKFEYIGLPEPPILTPDPEGVVVELVSEEASSLSPGDPVIFRGFTVGTILEAEFINDQRYFSYRAYVEPQYSELLCKSSRFWNAGGFDIDYGVDGLEMEAGTLESIISGGVAFDTPKGMETDKACDPGKTFKLYQKYDDILEQPYIFHADYYLLFDSSIAGLQEGAPVEYRGFQIGSVVRVAAFDPKLHDPDNTGPVPMPVHIRIDPARFGLEDSEESVKIVQDDMVFRVRKGLRAKLETRNLLTGSRFVTFDYCTDVKPEEISRLADLEVIPTKTGGFERLEEQLSQLLAKLNGLKLETTLDEINGAAVSIDTAMKSFNDFVVSEDLIALPGQLNQSMVTLENVLIGLEPDSRLYRKLESLLEELETATREIADYGETLNANPNAIIFSPSQTPDPTPEN